MVKLSETLVKWYKINERDLPWRKTKSPYKIWLSEIILQQTRIFQGLKYYNKIVKRYSSVFDLADANLDELLKLWQGLGYYNRAINLHATAKIIAHDLKGIFPQSFKELIKLKGIGEYTAAAIASIAFDEPVAVVDGNVYRFLSRYYGIKDPIDTIKGKKIIKQLANQLINKNNPGEYNQAIMEFGALQCVPKNPACKNCIFQSSCYAYLNNRITQFPLKTKKLTKKLRFLNYLLIFNDSEIILNQRKNEDIWKMLYEFPLIETDSEMELEKNIQITVKSCVGKVRIENNLRRSNLYKHILSHQIIHARFYLIKVRKEKLTAENGFVCVQIKKLHQYAFPRLIEKFMHKEFHI